jgi:hypothetical protein
VIGNVVWTDSWPSIAGTGCGLIYVGKGEEQAPKVYACVAFEEWRDNLAWFKEPGGRREVWVARWQENQDEVVDMSRCRVVAHN